MQDTPASHLPGIADLLVRHIDQRHSVCLEAEDVAERSAPLHTMLDLHSDACPHQHISNS